MQPKLCTDCRYYRHTGSHHMCASPKQERRAGMEFVGGVSLEPAEMGSCADRRNRATECSPEAYWFEPKPGRELAI